MSRLLPNINRVLRWKREEGCVLMGDNHTSRALDSLYLLLSSGWLPHRECYPAWSTSDMLEGGDEEKN